MTDDPDFYAWLDGELGEPAASAMAARVADDQELAAFAAQHRTLGARLNLAFAAIAAAPAPARLQAALSSRSADVIDLGEARERRRRWSVMGLAVAASLALGLSIGGLLPRDEGAFRARGDQLAAAGALGSALDRQLAGSGEREGIRIGLSFKDAEGRYCRTFAAGAQSGLACRSEENWRIEGLMRGEQPQGDYRMASGQDPAFAAMVESRMAGEPIDGEAEARLVEQRWRD